MRRLWICPTEQARSRISATATALPTTTQLMQIRDVRGQLPGLIDQANAVVAARSLVLPHAQPAQPLQLQAEPDVLLGPQRRAQLGKQRP